MPLESAPRASPRIVHDSFRESAGGDDADSSGTWSKKKASRADTSAPAPAAFSVWMISGMCWWIERLVGADVRRAQRCAYR